MRKDSLILYVISAISLLSGATGIVLRSLSIIPDGDPIKIGIVLLMMTGIILASIASSLQINHAAEVKKTQQQPLKSNLNHTNFKSKEIKKIHDLPCAFKSSDVQSIHFEPIDLTELSISIGDRSTAEQITIFMIGMDNWHDIKDIASLNENIIDQCGTMDDQSEMSKKVINQYWHIQTKTTLSEFEKRIRTLKEPSNKDIIHHMRRQAHAFISDVIDSTKTSRTQQEQKTKLRDYWQTQKQISSCTYRS